MANSRFKSAFGGLAIARSSASFAAPAAAATSAEGLARCTNAFASSADRSDADGCYNFAVTKRTRIRIARRWLLPAMIVYVLLGFWPAIDSGNLALAFAFIIGECAFGMAHTWLPRKYDAETRATADGIWIGDRLIATRNSIHSAHVRTARGGAWLRLERRFGSVDIALASPGDERA